MSKKGSSGRPSKSDPKFVLARRVAFDYCRNALGWPSIKQMGMQIDGFGDEYKTGERDFSSAWYAYARGEHDPEEKRLDLMERAAPGTKRHLCHVVWALMDNVPMPRDKLISIIRQLPAYFASIILSNPDPNTGYVAVHPEITNNVIYAVQRLNNLDAAAALQALTILLENDINMELRPLAPIALNAATRLLIRLSLYHPLQGHIEEIWSLLQRGHLQRLLPDQPHFSQVLHDYTQILNVYEIIKPFEMTQSTSLLLLSIADRDHFDDVVDAANKYLSGERNKDILKFIANLAGACMFDEIYQEAFVNGGFDEGFAVRILDKLFP